MSSATNKCLPAIKFGFLLSSLEDVTIGNELGLRLGDDTGRD